MLKIQRSSGANGMNQVDIAMFARNGARRGADEGRESSIAGDA